MSLNALLCPQFVQSFITVNGAGGNVRDQTL